MSRETEKTRPQRERVQDAQWLVARIARDHGDAYMPIYLRLEAELERLKEEGAKREEALRLASTPRRKRRAA